MEVQAHQEIVEPFWMAINWNWDPRWNAVLDIFSKSYVDQYDYRFQRMAFQLLPLFYFVYLPLSPLVIAFLAFVTFLSAMHSDFVNILGQETQGDLVSCLYFLTYITRLGYLTAHGQSLDFFNSFQLLVWSLFLAIFGVFSFNLVFPATFVAIVWDVV